MANMVARMLGWSKPQTQDEVPKKGDPEALINLVSFSPISVLHSSGTPFGVKIEMILRLAGLPYQAHCGDVTSRASSPKSKFPVLFHGDNVVPDSSAIVEYLYNTYPTQMAIFTPKDEKSKATAHMAQRMLEESTYFCISYLNWQRDDAWTFYSPTWAAAICPDLPGPVRTIMMNMFRSSVLRDLQGQGTGRHSVEEVTNRLKQDFDVCEALLQHSGVYLSGLTPTAADCYLWAILDLCTASSVIIKADEVGHMEQPQVVLMKERPALMAFYGRLKDTVFPDGPSKSWAKGCWDPKQHASVEC